MSDYVVAEILAIPIASCILVDCSEPSLSCWCYQLMILYASWVVWSYKGLNWQSHYNSYDFPDSLKMIKRIFGIVCSSH